MTEAEGHGMSGFPGAERIQMVQRRVACDILVHLSTDWRRIYETAIYGPRKFKQMRAQAICRNAS
jgi:hypothetical protein